MIELSDHDKAMYYCIVFDGPVRTAHVHSTLFRNTSEWNLKKRHYVSRCSVVVDDILIPTENLKESKEDNIGISRVKHHRLRSQSWSEDPTRNHKSPICELEVQVPNMFFSVYTATEIDELQNDNFYSKVPVTSSMSVLSRLIQK